MRFRLLFLLCLVVLLWVAALPVEAAPSITVTASWRPAAQLRSIDADGDGITDAGDDIRYATVDIYATVNVEFWAVGFVCTVNKAVLEEYTLDGDPNSTEDDVEMVTKGGAWFVLSVHTVNTVNTDGKISFAMTLRGAETNPLGSNGVVETLHIASIKYRVREDLSAAGSSPFSCTSNFLNRDGRRIVASRFSVPPALSILTGYTLTGNVKYQGIIPVPTAAQAILVICDDSDGDTIFDDVVTTANVTTGAFSVNNLRSQGRYDCQYIPNILNNALSPDAIHFTATTDFNLGTASFSLLPVLLVNGNVDTDSTPSADVLIDDMDMVMVTANWNAPTSVLTAPFMFGDATGDRKINEMDFALVGANLDWFEPISARHVIYSLARDATASFNNHLWIGNLKTSVVSPFGAATSRDYWPAVSPDGRRIAFIRNMGTNGADKFALFVAPITNGLAGTATRLSPVNATYDGFAPSWSPDGSQIAFVCSYNQEWADITDPRGRLCLIDANGQNFRLLKFFGQNDIFSRLQAPTWYESSILLYAHPDTVSTASFCTSRICGYYLAYSNVSGPLLPVGADMPYLRETALGWTLFYRFDNGAGSRSIRFAQLDANAYPKAAYPSTTAGSIHHQVSFTFGGPPLNNSVAYFNVSTGADPDILYYTSDPSADDSGGRVFYTYFFNGTSSSPVWSSGTGVSYYSISDALGNPAIDTIYLAAIPNTVAFVP